VRFGLRERFAVLLAALCALTLTVAAVGLFSPLDRLLRDAARETLAQTVHSELGDFTSLDAADLHRNSRRLLIATRPLRRTGADVAVLDPSGRTLVSTDPDPGEPFVAARDAVRTGKERRTVIGGSHPKAEIAVPVTIDGVPAIIAARRPIEDIAAVTRLLRRAFAVAAVAGLISAPSRPRRAYLGRPDRRARGRPDPAPARHGRARRAGRPGRRVPAGGRAGRDR
jgi:hypothetical protein